MRSSQIYLRGLCTCDQANYTARRTLLRTAIVDLRRPPFVSRQSLNEFKGLGSDVYSRDRCSSSEVYTFLAKGKRTTKSGFPKIISIFVGLLVAIRAACGIVRFYAFLKSIMGVT